MLHANSKKNILIVVSLFVAADSAARDCSFSCDSGAKSTFSMATNKPCHSIYLPRSAHDNGAYFATPVFAFYNLENFYTQLNIGVAYQHSFDECAIAHSLFGTRTLHFQGSQVANRDPRALIADNFGLSPFYDGSITPHPDIQNINLHFQEYFNLECLAPCMYGQINLTVSQQKRRLFECASTVTSTTPSLAPFPAGYMGADRAATASSIEEALSGTFLFGNMQTAWHFGRFSQCEQKSTKLAGVDLILGSKLWQDEHSLATLFIQYSPPTGTKIDTHYAQTIFKPIIGTGHHHQFGGGITTWYELWNNGYSQSLGAKLEGSALALFSNQQVRSFDFAEKGCMSRYMLLKELTETTTREAADFAYAGHLINAIDFATRNVTIKTRVKGDATLTFVYRCNGLHLGIGYNVYGQAEEQMNGFPTESPCKAIAEHTHYGFKGALGTHFFDYTFDVSDTISSAPNTQLLNSTASESTMFDTGEPGNPFIDNGTEEQTATTIGVDWLNALNGVPLKAANQLAIGDSTGELIVAQSSAPALEVSVDDLNRCSGLAPRQVSHKGFFTCDYFWQDCVHEPYLSFGIEAEGGHEFSTLRQWGMWAKLGFAF